MFTRIEIENYLGINKNIKLDFISKGRNREKYNSYIKIDDRESVNRIVGILGTNSTGKTSIIMAIAFIGSLLETPLALDSLIDTIKQIDEDRDLSEKQKENLKNKINDIKAGPSLQNQNVDSGRDNTILMIEMYIKSKDEEYTGFYQYELEYSGIYGLILTEKLSFKKNMKSLYKEIVYNSQDTKSKVGDLYRNYTNLIKMNPHLINEDKNIKNYKYIETFIKHYLDESRICVADSIENVDEDEMIEELDSEEKESFYSMMLNVIDNRLVKFEKIDDKLYIKNNKGNYIEYRYLSEGTMRCLALVRYLIRIIRKSGILVIDELELNLSMDLIKLIINIFINSTTDSQLIFTTNISQIFDVEYLEGDYIFKQDMIQLLSIENDCPSIQVLLNYRDENGLRIKNLQSFCRKYSENKILSGLSKETVNKILDISKTIQNF